MQIGWDEKLSKMRYVVIFPKAHPLAYRVDLSTGIRNYPIVPARLTLDWIRQSPQKGIPP